MLKTNAKQINQIPAWRGELDKLHCPLAMDWGTNVSKWKRKGQAFWFCFSLKYSHIQNYLGRKIGLERLWKINNNNKEEVERTGKAVIKEILGVNMIKYVYKTKNL